MAAVDRCRSSVAERAHLQVGKAKANKVGDTHVSQLYHLMLQPVEQADQDSVQAKA